MALHRHSFRFNSEASCATPYNCGSRRRRQLTKDVEKQVLSHVNEKYSASLEVNDLLDVATFIDPRFRTDYLNDIEKDGIIQYITEEAGKIARHLESTEPPKDSPEGQYIQKILWQSQTFILLPQRNKSWVVG